VGPVQVGWEAVVLPAWDGSKTALAGSKSGFGWFENVAIEALCSLSETGTGRAPAGTTKSFPSALVGSITQSHADRSLTHTRVDPSGAGGSAAVAPAAAQLLALSRILVSTPSAPVHAQVTPPRPHPRTQSRFALARLAQPAAVDAAQAAALLMQKLVRSGLFHGNPSEAAIWLHRLPTPLAGSRGGAELVLAFMADAVGAAARKLPEAHERVHTLLQDAGEVRTSPAWELRI
jgi:hypothetical protein